MLLYILTAMYLFCTKSTASKPKHNWKAGDVDILGISCKCLANLYRTFRTIRSSAIHIYAYFETISHLSVCDGESALKHQCFNVPCLLGYTQSRHKQRDCLNVKTMEIGKNRIAHCLRNPAGSRERNTTKPAALQRCHPIRDGWKRAGVCELSHPAGSSPYKTCRARHCLIQRNQM